MVAVKDVATYHLLAVGSVRAERTSKWLFASMCPHVTPEEPLPPELVAADITLSLLRLFLGRQRGRPTAEQQDVIHGHLCEERPPSVTLHHHHHHHNQHHHYQYQNHHHYYQPLVQRMVNLWPIVLYSVLF